MIWCEEEKQALLDAHNESQDEREQVWHVAARAVELDRARLMATGGTMPTEEHAKLDCRRDDDRAKVDLHIAALDATVTRLANWLANLTEVLCGERPIGVMPETTLEAARVLKAKAEALEAQLETCKAEENERNAAYQRMTSAFSRAETERDEACGALDAAWKAAQVPVRGMVELAEVVAQLRATRGEARAELARLKPSGQVAEDVEWLLHEHHHRHEPPEAYTERVLRLAALAQRTQEAEKAHELMRRAFRQELDAAQAEARTANERAETLHRSWQRAEKAAGESESQLRAIRERAESGDVDELQSKADRLGIRAFARWVVDGDAHDDSKGFDAGASMHEMDCESNISGPCTKGCGQYLEGAEAMRAACWEAVARELEADGYDLNGHVARRLKAAIEGAAP